MLAAIRHRILQTILFLTVMFAISGCSDEAADGENQEEMLLFFQNTALTENLVSFEPQFRLARKAGVKKFVFHARGIGWGLPAGERKWEELDRELGRFLDADEEASVAPRLLFEPWVGMADWTRAGAVVNSRGESLNHVSLSSQDFLRESKSLLRSLVRHVESRSNGKRVWAYYLAGQETGEWIPWNYRIQGPDYSEAARQGFRQWLEERYISDAEFSRAWGAEGLVRNDAEIPRNTEGRFPMRPSAKGAIVEAFYRLPDQQNWVDYSEYMSDLNHRWIKELSQIVKEESGKPVIVFMGYLFELPGSICGHFKVRDILKDGVVDFLGAPISYWPYEQRLPGGVGGPMGPADSMPLHGVTWLTEDDTKTHLSVEGTTVPDWYWDANMPNHRALTDERETDNLHRRNLAYAAFHGSSIWWMDLIAQGWFSDQSVWNLWTGEFGRDLRRIHAGAVPYRPTLAVIVDEESRLYEKWVYSGFEEVYPVLRNAAMASGAPVGFYYLDDFLEGRVPDSDTLLFVNAWRLAPERMEGLRARLSRSNSTVIWQYAPGYLNPTDGGVDGVRLVSGFSVKSDKGRLGSKGLGPLEGVAFGGKNLLNPRIVIDDPSSEPLARYLTGEVSAAEKTIDGRRTILIADIGWTPGLIHRLLGDLSSTDRPALVHRSDAALFVYALEEGEIRLRAPAGKRFGDGTTEMSLDLPMGESRLLELKSR